MKKAGRAGRVWLDLGREVYRSRDGVSECEHQQDIGDCVCAAVSAGNYILDIIGRPKRPNATQVKPGRLPPPVDITPDPIQEAAEVDPRNQVTSPE